ncbi:glycosyl transferase family 2 [Kyrpidia spormannii]|uniref:Glycosyl transferase family 2 n=2 Tax=Alicyclobacillaceae TaxID=186823 RepID=A0A2K8N9Z7_9BACL|nr:glycosyl transferase family 2 [Kyrpidia spormannii]MCL6577325.1 glycosyltransferase family 2 protein [Kyrpidia sp.]
MTCKMPKVLVIIPAYNEEKTVGQVVRRALGALEGVDVLVVDDGSRDATADVARRAGARVLRLPFNLGIGGAMQTGYRYAWRHGYDVAVQVDADGQHNPEDLPQLLRELWRGRADLIVGSRYVEETGYRSSRARRAGMIVLARLVSGILHQAVYDTTSGYRVVNREGIRLFAEQYPADYPEVEALVLAHYHGLCIREVAVKMEERKAGRSSITPLRSAYYMIKVILALMMNVLRRPRLSRENHG